MKLSLKTGEHVRVECQGTTAMVYLDGSTVHITAQPQGQPARAVLAAGTSIESEDENQLVIDLSGEIQNDPHLDWIDAHRDYLNKNFPNSFVALYLAGAACTVVCAAADQNEFIKRMEGFSQEYRSNLFQMHTGGAIAGTQNEARLDRESLAAAKNLLESTLNFIDLTLGANAHRLRMEIQQFLKDQATGTVVEAQTFQFQEGDGKPCYYCNEPCDGLAGNPGRWPVALCREDEPGKVKWQHAGCINEKLQELVAAEARIEQLEAELKTERGATASALLEWNKSLQSQGELLKSKKEAERNATYILENWLAPLGVAVRVREGGGPEDLQASLTVSVQKAVGKVKELEEIKRKLKDDLLQICHGESGEALWYKNYAADTLKEFYGK